MSSKFAKQYQVPPEFPEILKDFAREVLRNQPENVNQFAATYFECLSSGLPADAGGGMGGAAGSDGQEPDMSIDEVEQIIQDLFRKYDADGNYFLDPTEFKSLMDDLQQRLDFPPDEVLRFLAEADMNQDGMVEYEEFIPLALQIIQGMYAKKRLEQHMADVTEHAEELLVHGMSREELTDLVESIFYRMDQDNSGMLSKQEFVSALTSMELGLTRREINTIMFRVDQDQDGNVSYGEFVPFAFDLLQKLTSMRLLQTELEDDELGQYLMDLFKAKDSKMDGALHVDDVRDVLHEAMLGLSRMQIYTVISEADVNPESMIVYSNFIPKAVAIIRSMLSFDKSLVREHDKQACDQFVQAYDKLFAGKMDEVMPVAALMQALSGPAMAKVMNGAECKAVGIMLGQDEVHLGESKAQIRQMLMQIRRHKS